MTANSVGREKMKDRGIRLFEGSASFSSGHELEVGGERISAEKLVIATGAGPVIPPIEGLEASGYWTSYNAVYPDRQPESMVIIGGSAVGCEFAQIYSRLGTRVTVLEREETLMGNADGELGMMLSEVFESEGIEVIAGATVTSVANVSDGKQVTYRSGTAKGKRICDEILVAAGRAPVLDALSLQAAGVTVGDGTVSVDKTMLTSSSHIWACGDVTGGPMHSHAATYEGIVAGINCTAGPEEESLTVERDALPAALFTDPPFAYVGLTEDQAIGQGLEVRVGRAFFRDTGRADAMGETAGMVKLVAEPGGRLLGAHILGAGADMIIHEAVVAMGSHLGVEALLRPRVIHIHPTLSETLARAAAGAR